MNKTAKIRFVLSFFLIFSLMAPIAVLAKDGKKHFKEGMKAEASEEWDKAAEMFALAVAENPRNPEYRLHYTRALFNASQMYIKKGNNFAAEKDYQGAYNAFRRAYAFDPTNELAKAEMERMSRLYREANGINIDGTKEVKMVRTTYDRTNIPTSVTLPPKLEELGRVGPFPGGMDLKKLITDLARSLDLNVIFDQDSFRSVPKIDIELLGVTTAKALDYIFLQNNLFFQKVGPRTILVANATQRQKFQQLVLRTFYLANASPKDVENLIRTIIPAQPGRTPTIAIKDDATNSITIRDTAENIALLEKLINSLDKDRAEVVMDVAIYEVSKSDLLRLGNQIGSSDQLTTLGGTTRGLVGLGGNELYGTLSKTLIPTAFGAAFAIPSATLSAFQSKQNTKLLASTQIHAFNNEDSSARIGQRVPVTTAQISNGFNNTGNNNVNTGFLSNVVNYEQVGLTLKFKPIVFPNQDVQVAMEIESKDVVACASTDANNNPCFSERTIKGTARVQNNKTLMLASVAQDTQSNGRSGLPLLGLIPVLGRLFTAPSNNNQQVDIIIAVTPRVIRAPSVLPEDLVERPTGSLAVPTSGSLEAMVIQEAVEEQLANQRRLGNNTAVQLPDRKPEDSPVYIRSDRAETDTDSEIKSDAVSENTDRPTLSPNVANIRPIDSSDTRTLSVVSTSDTSTDSVIPKPVSLPLEETSLKVMPKADLMVDAPRAELKFLPGLPELKAGEKTKVAVMVKSATAFRSAVLALKYDPAKIAVRAVSYGEVFGAELGGREAKPYINQNGKTFVSLGSMKNTADYASGVLAYIEVEALADGQHQIGFDFDALNIMTADGKDFAFRF